MPLIKDGRVIEDVWETVADEAPLPHGPVIVSLTRLRAELEELLARGTPLGVRLKSSERARDLGDVAQRLALIALEFPTFRDGRAYSTARVLRECMGFRGELRAVGDVLRDQVFFMRRCGFDAFEMAGDQALEGWLQAMGEFTVFYQPAADDRTPASQLRRLRKAAE
jgi:uncharacterized protein (DUF934 family)